MIYITCVKLLVLCNCNVLRSPVKGWSCSLWHNMHDHEGDSTASQEKLAHLARQYKFLIYMYWSLHFPLLKEASSRSLMWVLSECLAPLHPTTCTVVPGQARPYPAQGPRASSSLRSRSPNLRVTALPPFCNVLRSPNQGLIMLALA